MSVSIIAGQWKGRKLKTPDGDHTRPLLGRIKQSLFDVLGQRLDGLSVIDVCAGSGSFGFEAASRGATVVHFIENNPAAIAVLQENMRMLGNPDHCLLHPTGFQHALPALSNADLIYADPPFPWYHNDQQQLAELLKLAAASLAEDGRFLIRGDKHQSLPAMPAEFVENFHRLYGRSWIRQMSLSKT